MKGRFMTRHYFYCPHIRDGYGTPIHHYECPQCHNLDAGYMRFRLGEMSKLPDEEQKEYFKSVIGMYQNIRGVKG